MFSSLHRTLAKHKAATLLITAGVCAIIAAGSIRLRLYSDLAHLLGGADDPLAQPIALLSKFKTFETLLIDVSGVPSQLTDRADELAKKLEASGQFQRIHFRMDPTQSRAIFDYLFEHRLQLMSPASLQQGLERARSDLSSPIAIAAKSYVLRDPFAHRAQVMEVMAKALPKLAVTSIDGMLFSRDKQHVLILAEPKISSTDTEGSRRLLSLIQQLKSPQTTVEIFGPHLFSASAAASVKADITVTLSITLGLLALLYVITLRKLRLVLLVFLPAIGADLLALGILGWCGMPLHGISIGFGSLVLGIGIDYGAHIIMHHIDGHSIEDIFSDIGRGLLGGYLITALCFLVVAFVPRWLGLAGSRIFFELGLVVTIGITCAFVLSVVLVPLLLPVATPHPRQRQRLPTSDSVSLRKRGFRGPVVLLAVAALIPLYGLTRVYFDGNIRNLDHQPAATRRIEQDFSARYAVPKHATLIVAQGPRLQDALQANDRVYQLLLQAEHKGDIPSFQSIAPLLPSIKTQKHNVSQYAQPSLTARLDALSQQFGFQATAFSPFWRDVAAAKDAGEVTADTLKKTPLADWVSRYVHPVNDGYSVLSTTFLAGDAGATKVLPPELKAAILAIPGVQVVSTADLGETIIAAVKKALVQLTAAASLVVILVLLVFLRQPAWVALVASAMVAVLAWTLGFLGWIGVPINIVSVGAFALIMGLGIDHVIFSATALQQHRQISRVTRHAIVLAALTTLVSSVSFIFTHNPVMKSLGITITAGVVACLFSALWLVPCGYRVLKLHDSATSVWRVAALILFVVLSLIGLYVWMDRSDSHPFPFFIGALLVNGLCAALIWIQLGKAP